MNKILITTSLIFLITLNSSAQITLTAASFPNLGDKYISHHDTLTASATPGNSGTNQTWDFSGLNDHYKDTTLVVDPATTPDGAQFPTATLAGIQQGNYAYMVETATQCNFIGVTGSFQGIAAIIHYITPNIVAKSGITYNSNYSFVNSWILTMTGAQAGQPLADSIRIKNDTYTTKVADGWGTVTTVYNSYPCLRIKQINSAVLVVDALVFGTWNAAVFTQTSVNVIYSYVDNDNINDIVTLNMDSTSSTVNNASYRDDWYAGTTDLLKPSLFSVYPNPNSGNDFSILVGGLPKENYLFQIFDMKGSLVYSSTVFVNETSATEIKLKENNFSAGNYSAVISSGNKKLSNIQFTVSK